MDLFIRIAQLLLSLSILVLIHELGHFGFARLFKVRVDKFYLFFNPWFSLFKYKSKRSGTEYGLGWLPLGGYCKIAGMVDESMDTNALKQPPQPWEYRSQKNWKKLLIISGGVLVNFFFALLVYSMISWTWGKDIMPVKEFEQGFTFNQTAINAGFQTGDKIIAVNDENCEEEDFGDIAIRLMIEKIKKVTVLRNGQSVDITLPDNFIYESFQEGNIIIEPIFSVIIDSISKERQSALSLQPKDQIIKIGDVDILNSNAAKKRIVTCQQDSLTLQVIRNGQVITLTEKLDIKIVKTDTVKTLGVYFQPMTAFFASKHISYNLISAIPAGIQEGVKKLSFYVKQLRFLFTKKGASSMGGFGTISKLFTVTWDWLNFWTMTAFLSVMLAFMNILPIPALDGGHLIFILVEMITGRKLSDKFLEVMQTVGFILVITLVLYANFSDVIRAFF